MRNVFLLVSFFLFISCTAEIDQVIYSSKAKALGEKTVFYAMTESSQSPDSPSTKVYADENMKVLWNEGDQITIFNKITYNHGFEFDGEDGDTAGGFEQFTDEPSGFYTVGDLDFYYAVYPYNTGTKINNSGQMTVMLPSEQTYKENSFGIGANTMVAVSDSPRLKFKNVGGYLSLRLYGDNVKVSRVTIKGNNGEKIAGKAKVTIPLGGVPTTVMDNSATDEISIVCDPAVQIGADAEHYTDFWFVIPPVTFSGGFAITVTDELGGTFVMTTTRNLTVTRNHLDWMNPLEVVPNYDNVFVPFDDANFKAYCVEFFDANGDGEISLAEASTKTHINCRNKQIQSLSGIENFINLTLLDCSSNQLASLDVSGCTALEGLYCYSNQLTNLDVSHNSELRVLNCDSNQLTSLDVSNNTALTLLVCSSNQLTSLDVSGCTALEGLDCHSNQLTSLDVSGCTALTKLECGSNHLTSLDVSHNMALTSLYCHGNQLTSLDVSNNTALFYLSCDSNQLTSLDVSHNTALEGLYCYSNQLTSLDVSHNTALERLGCHSNQLTSLDVSANTALWYLECNSNQLTSLDVSGCTELSTLHCNSNPLLTEIWLKTGQTISDFFYDTNVATIKYKD